MAISLYLGTKGYNNRFPSFFLFTCANVNRLLITECREKQGTGTSAATTITT